RHHRHVDALQQEVGKVGVSFDACAAWRRSPDHSCAAREGIECTFGRSTSDVWYGIQCRHNKIASRPKAFLPILQEALRSVQRCDRSRLADGGGTRGGLALDDSHCLDQLSWTTGITNTPAGHRISLGNAVDGKRARLEARLEGNRCDELETIVDDVLVHIVYHQPYMGMALEYLYQ